MEFGAIQAARKGEAMRNRLHQVIALVFVIGGLVLAFHVFATAVVILFGLALSSPSLDPNYDPATRAFVMLLAATVASLVATVMAGTATARRRPQGLMLAATVGFALAAVLCALVVVTAAWIADMATVLAVGAALLGVLAGLATVHWERLTRVVPE